MTEPEAASRLVGGRFELQEPVGTGGMGVVWRARDRWDGATVAVKLLHQDGEQDEQRFEREAHILAELDHPGIVRYVAHGAAPERFLAIEWLQGEDLHARLRRQ